jgi:uncharacterized protein YodC (DUF2158 family)
MRKQTELKVGDIVHLNSGSSDMKIVDIQKTADVEWLNDEGGVERATYPVVCLTRDKVYESDELPAIG